MAGILSTCRRWLRAELPADSGLLDALLGFCSEYPGLGMHVLGVAVGVVVTEFEGLLNAGVAADLLSRWS